MINGKVMMTIIEAELYLLNSLRNINKFSIMSHYCHHQYNTILAILILFVTLYIV